MQGTRQNIIMTPADNYSGIEVIGLNEARRRVQDLLELAYERFNTETGARSGLAYRIDALRDVLEVLR